ncbi:unnamed protein product, partial [Rotaria sordida]
WKVGNPSTTVSAIVTLRENMEISYRTLLRFKGIATLDPIISTKFITLRLCANQLRP